MEGVMGTVVKLNSQPAKRRRDVLIEGLQLALDFGDEWGLETATKNDLARALGQLAPPEKWGYVVLNPEQQRLVIKAIQDGARPGETAFVWQTVISYIAYDRNGEIMADRTTIAEAAGVLPKHVSTALTRLVEIGALIKLARGHYAINPHVGWCGPAHKRELAAKDYQPVAGPLLTLMEGGRPVGRT